MAGSYACARVTPITVWIVSKNESNCLLENKMVSTLDASDHCSLFSQIPSFSLAVHRNQKDLSN